MTSKIDRKDLNRYKRVLLERRGGMSIARAETESPIPAAGGWAGDEIDQANADAYAELQIQLHQTDLRLLRAIEEALVRIRHGTFGTCEACRNPISRARLEAVPWTRLVAIAKSANIRCELQDSLTILSSRPRRLNSASLKRWMDEGMAP